MPIPSPTEGPSQEKNVHEEDEEEEGEGTEMADAQESKPSKGALSAPPPPARPRGLICSCSWRLPPLGPQMPSSLMMGIVLCRAHRA